MLYTSYYDSPVGRLMLSSDGDSVTGLWIDGQKHYAASIAGMTADAGEPPVLKCAAHWLDDYFAGNKPDPSRLPLAPAGSAFRRLILGLLTGIPYGQTATYKQLADDAARRMGVSHMSCQAVGSAISHNPISIIIPCHRAVGSSGSLTGYAGGLAVKERLLAHEGADMSRLFMPADRRRS